MHVSGSNAVLLFADPGQDPRILPRECISESLSFAPMRTTKGMIKIALCPFLALSPPMHHLRQVRLIYPRDTRTGRMCVRNRLQGVLWEEEKGSDKSPMRTTVRAEG